VYSSNPKDFEEYATKYSQFQLDRCRTCSCIFINPPPTIADTRNFYPTDYMSLDKSVSIFKAMFAIWYQFLAKKTVTNLGTNTRLLDYGCGEGQFVDQLRKAGAKTICGLDPMRVSDNSRKIYNEISQLPLGFFDVIFMRDVLEHLTDIDQTMTTIRSLLRPGGKVLIETPNAAHFSVNIFKNLWGGLHFPYHTVIFSPTSIQMSYLRWGFNEIQITPNLIPGMWAMSFQNILKLKHKRRGRLALYPVIILISAPFWLLDYLWAKITHTHSSHIKCELLVD
jgi:SAM-dependent methyltransferase